jgi:2-methylcitrate dehydratase PrpD
LNDAEMLQALGTAGTQAAGLWEFNADGAMSKPLHPGKAAFNGILAADLARAGFTGASRILEGERGFFRAESTGADPSRITEGLGERWKIGENCYKLHACCGHTHTAIDVALELRQRLGTDEAVAAQITEIRIGTYGPGFAIVKELNPRSSYQAQFSLAYCVAVALLDGRAGLEQFAGRRFGPNGVEDSALAALLERTRITVDDTLTGKYPAAWPARLELVLRNGDRLQGEADFPRGNPENPVSTDTLREKLLSLVGERFGRETAHRALEAVQSIDRADDMSRVFSLFSSLTPVAR